MKSTIASSSELPPPHHPPIYRAKGSINKPPTRPSPALRAFAAPVEVEDSAPVGVLSPAAGAVEDGADVMPAPPEVVDRGPSQCQWSPCGSQPMDSVGLGAMLPEPVLAGWSVWSSSSWPSWSSWSSWSSEAALEMTMTPVVVVGLKVTAVGAVVVVTAPSQSLFAW